MHRRKYLYGVIMAAMMVIAACSGNNGEPSSGATEPSVVSPTQPTEEPISEPTTPSEEPSEPEPTTPAPPPATQPPDHCSNQEWPEGVSPRAAEATTALGELAGVRVGTHDCYDRIAFDFTGTTETSGLGYRVEYVDQVTQGGSGNPVPVEGAAYLQVVLDGVMPDLDAGFAGELDYTRDWPALQEVKYAGWFEGQHTFAIGVSEKGLPVRVVRYKDKTGRIMVYIDFGHPELRN